MGRRQNDPDPTRFPSLLLLLVALVSCVVVYAILSVILRPGVVNSHSGLNSLDLIEDEDGGLEESGECCRGIKNLELWGAAVKWGSEHKFNSPKECCRACKAMCSGTDGPCLCDTWVFCGDRKACGSKFGEVSRVLKLQMDFVSYIAMI